MSKEKDHVPIILINFAVAIIFMVLMIMCAPVVYELLGLD